MIPVFADTSFYVAILNPRDSFHAQAKEVAAAARHGVVTTEFVLAEVANFFSPAPWRALFVNLVGRLIVNKAVTVLPASTELFACGWTLFAARPDKNWSLIDCISFVVTQDHAITEALTGDHHFEQAGFSALLK